MRRTVALVFVACAACASSPVTPATTEQVLDLVFDTPAAGTEDYVCLPLPLDADATGAPIVAIHWDAPSGPVSLHHATLYATSTATTPTRGTDCEAFSTAPAVARALDVWVAGSDLTLGDGVALALPPATVGFMVQAHILRTSEGRAAAAHLHLTTTTQSSSDREVAWTGLAAPVPALRPHDSQSSSVKCTVNRAVHVIDAWPHMHRLGVAIDVDVAHAGATASLVHVSPWNFASQPMMPVSINLTTGDTLTLTCAWNNEGDDYVFPGPLTTNEMCAAGLIAGPAPDDWLDCR